MAASEPEKTTKNADIKIILLGDSAVGKSKLIERFLLDNYEKHQLSTYALTVFRHQETINDRLLDIEFWDTAGQERFASMHPAYYHRAHACIMVFDVTRKTTYQNLQTWYKELLQFRPAIPTFVVANKIDVDYNVTQKSFAFASKNNLPFHFVSAADGANVVKVFRDAIDAALAYKETDTDDFLEEALRTVDYFDQKEKSTDEAKPLSDKPVPSIPNPTSSQPIES